MRRSCRAPLLAAAAFASSVACAGTALVGCSFLIDFTKADSAAEDASVDTAPPEPTVEGDASVDTNLPDALPEPDATPDAALDAIANPDACSAIKDGKYCGGNQITWPPERKDDLITCKGGTVSLVTPCTTGEGCKAMVNGYPDECDECVKKPDGTYCGRDIPGWSPANENQRIRCQSGRVVTSLLCITCVSNGVNSACK